LQFRSLGDGFGLDPFRSVAQSFIYARKSLRPPPQMSKPFRRIQEGRGEVAAVASDAEQGSGCHARLHCSFVVAARELRNRQVEKADSLMTGVASLPVEARGFLQVPAQSVKTSRIGRITKKFSRPRNRFQLFVT